MPKNGFLTPKAISNRIKAKGLNKLRWYCQMCEKTCRDANGFKCHLTSESHQRQMLMFANNSKKFLDEYSNEFHTSYYEILKRRGESRVLANKIYQEVIGERHHTHMNSTSWGSLTAYLRYLGEQGLATVEDTPKGIFITYIDQTPDTVKRAKEKEKVERAEARDAARFQKSIDKRVAQLTSDEGPVKEPEYDEFKRTDGKQIEFAIASTSKQDELTAKINDGKRKLANVFGDDEDDDNEKNDNENNDKDDAHQQDSKRLKADDQRKRSSAVSAMAAELEEKKAKNAIKRYWLKPNIVVKVLNKKVGGGAYYKKKGVVLKVHEKFIGEIEMLKSGDVLRLDQIDLETVLPSIGGKVLFVNGVHRGEQGILQAIDVKKFCATVKLITSVHRGEVIQKVDYEHISKLHPQ